jgi:uncharacterized protein (TIGR02145 family)
MYTYDDINLSYDGINRYPCSLSETGWRRCADNNGTDAGGTYGAGKSLKAIGQGSGNGAGNDLVGFKGMLAGYRTDGSFHYLGTNLYLWSSSESSSTSAWRRIFFSSYSTINRYTYNKGYGFSVRCLRDSDDTTPFTDPRDGNVYPCVKIGNQVWMTKNLAYLPSVNAPDDGSTTEPKYYVYGNTGTDVEVAKATTNYQTYGVLYNWPAAMASAPTGFHVPTDAELNELEVFVFNMLYKDVSYDGYNAFIDKNYDYQYASENADRQLTITKTEIDTLNASDTGNRQIEVNRTATDSLSISETFKKVLTRVVKDTVEIGEMCYRTIANTVSDTLELIDKAFKTISTTVSDTLNISDNASRLLTIGRSAIDRIGASETFKHCKNGIELIWNRLTNKPTTTYNKTNKPTTNWNNPDKPNRCSNRC